MKYLKITINLTFCLCTFLSNSQEKEYDVSESMFVEWIESTVDFLQQNKDNSDVKLIDRLSSLMINPFYPYPREEDKFESFNGTIITFFKNNYPLRFGKEKLYFLQKLSTYGHTSSNDYLIVDNENNLTELYSKYNGKIKWYKKKTSKFNFKEFEDKFNSLKKFQKCENKNEGGFFYYLITEFDGEKINIKFVDVSCDLKF